MGCWAACDAGRGPCSVKLGAGPGKGGEMGFEAAEREKRRDGPAGRGNWPWAGLGRELGFRVGVG